MGVLAFSALDLSSYCHPTEEGERAATAVKAAGMLPDVRVAAPAIEGSEAYAELTWRMLEDVGAKGWKPSTENVGAAVEALPPPRDRLRADRPLEHRAMEHPQQGAALGDARDCRRPRNIVKQSELADDGAL